MAEELHPNLMQILGYLHEDWPEMYGSPERAVDNAIGEHPLPNRRKAYAQLRSMIETAEDDIDLRRILNRCFRARVLFRKPRDARMFAAMVEKKLAASLNEGDDI
jgi:hypothetical protein